MNRLNLLIIVGITTLVFITVIIVLKRRPKKLKTGQFVVKWRQLQQHCKDRSDWPRALKDADALLDCALKKRKYKGKTTGARLMAAQRQIKNNDGIWVAHNLVKKIQESDKGGAKIKLNKTQVKDSLQSYQEALVDLGALRRASK